MQRGVDVLSVAAGNVFERDFLGEGEILVKREGYSRLRHVFTRNGKVISRLRWHGMRRAVYETEESHFIISVGALGKRISLKTDDGGQSFLIERSPANPRRERLRAEMAEGDNFRITRSWDSRFRSEISLAVHKEFYASTLLVFRFDTRRRTQTTVHITVQPTLKWEAKFAHRLLALLVCRIILERRHSGAPALKIKESPRRFSRSARVRERKQVRG
jgi:hypothetical protein